MKHARLHATALAVKVPPPFPSPGPPLSPGRALFLPLPEGEPLDLEATLRCGQAFRWRRHGDAWYGPYGRGSLCLRAVPGGVEARALGVEPPAEEVRLFLGLHHRLAEVYRRLETDRWVARGIAAAPGLRLLRQDPWECLAGFVCSQNSNIPKIELCTERVARAWGETHRWEEGVEVASFPRPEALARAPEAALRACGLGYRSPYLLAAARAAAGEAALERLRGAPREEALAALTAIPGVGRKVADCVLLFALDRLETCPVDVWVRRAAHALYPRALARYLPDAAGRGEKALSPREYEAIGRFARERWGLLAGYAQQYLFHALRGGRLGAPPAGGQAFSSRRR